MFYRESERIAERHPDLLEIIGSLDQILSTFPEGGHVQLDIIADALDIPRQQCAAILNEFVADNLLDKVEMIKCPSCSNLIDASEHDVTPTNSGSVTCSSCEASFSPTEQDWSFIYLLMKPGRGGPARTIDQPKVLLALHGIMTHAHWHATLNDVVAADGWRCRTDRWFFGRYPLWRFLLLNQRNNKVAWFRKEYDEECRDIEAGLNLSEHRYPSIVAHSFGTYVLGNALLKYDYIKFNKVILCGSILPVDFPWDQILDRGQVQHVRNDFGTGDNWSRRANWGVKATGPSGAVGFTVEHERLEQAEFPYEHSEYFDKGHIRSKWLSFLNDAKPFRTPCEQNLVVPRWKTPWLFGLFLVLILSLVIAAAMAAWLILRPTVQHIDTTFVQLMADFHRARDNARDLAAFKRDYVGKRVTWEVFVKSVRPDEVEPDWTVAPRRDSTESVLAFFPPTEFRESVPIGSRFVIAGTIAKGTNVNGVMLEDCSIVRRIDGD